MMSGKTNPFFDTHSWPAELNYWGWLLLMEGTPAVDMVKKIPLFTSGWNIHVRWCSFLAGFLVAINSSNIYWQKYWNLKPPKPTKVESGWKWWDKRTISHVNHHPIEVSPIETGSFFGTRKPLGTGGNSNMLFYFWNVHFLGFHDPIWRAYVSDWLEKNHQSEKSSFSFYLMGLWFSKDKKLCDRYPQGEWALLPPRQ